jgi:hypothetical protein
VETHTCARCKETKPLTDFPGNKKFSYCKPCNRIKAKESLERNWGNTRHYHLVGRYGITEQQADEILSNPCEICGGIATNIDHDHITGFVRGGLCGSCNRGVGQLKDDVNLVRKALTYLEQEPKYKTVGRRHKVT